MDFGGVEIADCITKTCFATNTGSRIRSYNRAYNYKSLIADDDVKEIISYFGETPFTWAVDESDHKTTKLLDANVVNCVGTFPAMALNLTTVEPTNYKSTIVIQEVIHESDLETWLSIVAQSFSYQKTELTKAIKNLVQRASGTIKFYVGFYENKPVAASMIVQHHDSISLHTICTLSEYRGNGLGYAITHKALIDAKLQGFTRALLLAREMGKSLYEKMGFKEYARYKMYCNYTVK